MEQDRLFDRAELLARTVIDWRIVLRLHLNRGGSRFSAGDLEGYRSEARQALAIGEKFVQTRGPASYLAEACLFLGEWEEGRRAARIACAPGRVLTPGHRAMLTWMEGEHETAVGLYRDAVADARPMRAMQYVVQYLGLLADGALQLGFLEEAMVAAREATELIRRCSYWGQVDYAFGPLVEAAAWSKAAEAGAILQELARLIDRYAMDRVRPQLLRAHGVHCMHCGRVLEAMEALQSSAELARRQHALPELGRTLAVVEVAARAQGNLALATAAAVERAAVVQRIGPEARGLRWAEGLPAAPIDPRSGGNGGLLTRRERQVAGLVARGFTNKQIAEALVIADGTAGVHVDHILAKLGVHSRAQVAAWVAEQEASHK